MRELFKLNIVNVINQYGKNMKLNYSKIDNEKIKTLKAIQVNNAKFINCFIFTVPKKKLDQLEKLKFPNPNYMLELKNDFIQIIYTLKNPLNLSSEKIKRYYIDIFSSMLKHLNINSKNNKNIMINNNFTKITKNTQNKYVLGDFKHLIIRNNNKIIYKNYNNHNKYVFKILARYSLRNTFLVLKDGEYLIEKEGFRIARKLIRENRLNPEDLSAEELLKMVNKIYKYVLKNSDRLLKKYGNIGRYNNKVARYKILKRKQQESGKMSAKINARNTQDRVIETIGLLLKTDQKITIKTICQTGNFSNKTVIKYYQSLKDEIKEHNKNINI